MPALIVEWDHVPGEFPKSKRREFPIDTQLRVKQNLGYATLERLDRGIWNPELTTPGDFFIRGVSY
jgi:hypothetical protein